MKYNSVLVALVTMSILFVSVNAQNLTLDDYIQTGFRNNLNLCQRSFVLEKSKEAVNEAFGSFLPSIELSARYTETSGNVLDLGTLINPAYSTLNRLLNASGVPSQFPENISIKLPYRQETKITLVQPVFNSAIIHNYKMQKDLQTIEQYSFDKSRRELASEIKDAYFNYAKASELVEIYRGVLILTEEHRRISESLVKNQKVTEDVLLRADAELSEIKQTLFEAEKQKEASILYFNLLLNRNEDEPVEIISGAGLKGIDVPALEDILLQAENSREELLMITSGITASENVVSINTASFLPNLTLVADYGFQGDEYNFRKDQDYASVSLIASWNIFNGLKDQAKRAQSKLEVNELQTKKEDVLRLIKMKVRMAYNDMLSEKMAMNSAKERKVSAEKYFSIINRKYENGTASYLEFLDAKTSFTNAQISLVISEYNYYQKCVQIERESAMLDLSKYDRS